MAKVPIMLTDNVEEILETIDFAIYEIEQKLEKLRDKFDRLKSELTTDE